jgi:hypothetical protein
MVKLLKDLKVAEVREALVARKESKEGKKADLIQRLSDWIEDNDFDPDTYDFAAADIPQRKTSEDAFNSEPGGLSFLNLKFTLPDFSRALDCRRARRSGHFYGNRLSSSRRRRRNRLRG